MEINQQGMIDWKKMGKKKKVDPFEDWNDYGGEG